MLLSDEAQDMSPRSRLSNVFVTVGSTQFDQLIDCIIEEPTLEILKEFGCRRLTIQYGSYKNISNLDSLKSWTTFEIEMFDYQNSIDTYIENADLVIGHAGAGTTLEVLRKGKPLLIVINDHLMDNHQEELALELTESKYALCSNTRNFRSILRSLDISELRPFPKADPTKFRDFITRIYQHKHRAK